MFETSAVATPEWQQPKEEEEEEEEEELFSTNAAPLDETIQSYWLLSLYLTFLRCTWSTFIECCHSRFLLYIEFQQVIFTALIFCVILRLNFVHWQTIAVLCFDNFSIQLLTLQIPNYYMPTAYIKFAIMFVIIALYMMHK